MCWRTCVWTFAPGNTWLWSGPSGVGKTTLCSLIPRFYEVSAGCVFARRPEYQRRSTALVAQNIGIVHQDVYLFAGTVADNIRYGKLAAAG